MGLLGDVGRALSLVDDVADKSGAARIAGSFKAAAAREAAFVVVVVVEDEGAEEGSGFCDAGAVVLAAPLLIP